MAILADVRTYLENLQKILSRYVLLKVGFQTTPLRYINRCLGPAYLAGIGRSAPARTNLPASLPYAIDGDVPTLGRYAAARRVARTVFIGSAPSVAGQQVRGLEEVRIRLGCAQPGEPTAVFGDALRRMSSQLTYLYTDGSRYWYDTRPTVNRLARDRAQQFSDGVVEAEIIGRLKKVPKNGSCRLSYCAARQRGCG